MRLAQLVARGSATRNVDATHVRKTFRDAAFLRHLGVLGALKKKKILLLQRFCNKHKNKLQPAL